MSARFGGLWQHPTFVKLWAGQTVSVFGSMITGSALPFTAILALDASPFEVALLYAARMVPAFFAGFLAGVFVDRWARRPLMIACDIGRAAILLTVPLAYLFDALTMEHLYAVALGAGVLTMFFDVAYQSYLPSIVSRDELLEGNSKLTASSAVAEFGGFSVSGWLVQIFSGPAAIFVDALTFVGSALFLRSIDHDEARPQPSEADQTSVRAESIEGFRAVMGDPLLRPLALAGALSASGFGVYGAVYMLFVTRDLGFDAGILGVVFGIGGLSSLAGALLAERVGRRLGIGVSMVAGLTMMAGSMLLISFTAGATLLAGAILVAQQVFGDGAYTVHDINATSLRQSVAPEHALGRVNAFMRTSEVGCALVATLIGGVLGETIGLRTTLGVGAALVFAAVLCVLASPLREIRSAPVTAVPALPEVALRP